MPANARLAAADESGAVHEAEVDVRRCRKLITAEEGSTAIEYALIAALISVVLITALTLVGSSLLADFQRLVSVMNTGGGGA